MTSKSIIVLVVVLAIVLGGGALYLYTQQIPSSTNGNPQAQGKIIFGIKDAAASMGAISSVMITVNKIEIHNQTQGWVTVSTANSQYDLLALKASGATSLLAQTNVAAGTYDQTRLMVSKVLVTQNSVAEEAKLPSGELKIVGTMVVNANQTSTAVFDFITDKSLHVTGNGKFIFTPVIKLQTQSDTDATVDVDGHVQMSTGHVDTDTTAGMDVNGEMKANFELGANTKLDIVNDILKVTTPGESDKSLKVTAQTAVSTAISSGSLDSAISVTLVTQNGKKEWLVSGLKGLVLTNAYVDAETGAVLSY